MRLQHFLFIFLVLGLFGAVVWNGFIKTPPPVATPEPTVPQDELPWEQGYTNASENLIRVDLTPGEFIASPVTVTGTARGFWFFEASFPVMLVNWDGLIIAQGIAQADGDWMTEEFVPFSVTLTFEKPSYGERGAIIFKRDNPSGLPENDAALEVPIRFK